MKRMKRVTQRFFVGLILMGMVSAFVPSCGSKKEMRMQIEELQKEVATLRDENEALHKQVEILNNMVGEYSELNKLVVEKKKAENEDAAKKSKEKD